MTPRRWFVPETPDVLGDLRRQLAVTRDGIGALAAWAAGDAAAAARVRAAEDRGDVVKRALLETLQAAFVTPIEPEDLFTLSRGIDRVLDGARDVVNEAEAMACAPDAGLAEMTRHLGEALDRLDAALADLVSAPDAATASADAAIAAERRLERSYYAAMAASLGLEGRAERIARRELYRRTLRLGELVVDVADRVVYAIVKQR